VHFDFWVVLIYLAVCAGIVGFALLLARLVSPRLPNAEKSTPYECGERPIGSGWFSFNPRFYLMALVFIVFDVEIALTYPVATVVRQWVDQGRGGTAVLEILIFIAILAAALAYVWGRGDLDWVRDIHGPLADAGAPADPCGARRSAEDE
jgi:NADH-quinone oxidoreductase subunit A